jgi:hypothetical protein
MAKKKLKWLYTLGILVFIAYVLIAAVPVPKETILKPRWITSLESSYPVSLGESAPGGNNQRLLPFRLGERYGYIREDGTFAINQIRGGYISMSENMWAEYEAQPSSVRVMNPQNELSIDIENTRGYPLFLDNRIFMVGIEQNSLAAVGSGGETLWVHDFPAPITCIDAANGFVLAGTLDGAVVLLDSKGGPVFTPFEPGGSRLSVILGCALSKDASLLAIISGIDNQRFLLMEHFSDTYRVIYHEFLTGGFRRPVHISFVDNDSRIAYEREGGLGIYTIDSRANTSLYLDGEIAALDTSGGSRFLFVITAEDAGLKRFYAIRYPGTIVIQAPFRSGSVFLARLGEKLFLGGDYAMASLELEKK